MNFNFNSRETYLQYRQEWKEKYFLLIKNIQAAKNNIKIGQRENNRSNTYKAYCDLYQLHKDIQDHLSELNLARNESSKQRLLNINKS